MNLSGKEQVVEKAVNVVSLFNSLETEVLGVDPLATLIEEGQIEDTQETIEVRARNLVNENQFPDQSMYILEAQLSSLKSSLNRMKFYLGELDDILPAKNR